ncbi:hypothetical protein RRG08_014242 [Elysia crispata]|uniref:Uncharacterized protein n=1 Tax=Elysia crispata TaxID=231223 RepID=A0AAE1CF02_9GAST|nr:hypothetical protein RRG08_014242 [Elysia crispata]
MHCENRCSVAVSNSFHKKLSSQSSVSRPECSPQTSSAGMGGVSGQMKTRQELPKWSLNTPASCSSGRLITATSGSLHSVLRLVIGVPRSLNGSFNSQYYVYQESYPANKSLVSRSTCGALRVCQTKRLSGCYILSYARKELKSGKILDPIAAEQRLKLRPQGCMCSFSIVFYRQASTLAAFENIHVTDFISFRH